MTDFRQGGIAVQIDLDDCNEAKVWDVQSGLLTAIHKIHEMLRVLGGSVVTWSSEA